MRAIETVGAATLSKVQEAAVTSLRNFANETHGKLDESVTATWTKARTEAAQALENKLREFLGETERHINTVLAKIDEPRPETTLAVPKSTDLSTLGNQLQQRVQGAVDIAIKDQVDTVASGTKTQLKARFRHLIKGYVKGAIEDARDSAVSAAEAAAAKSTEAVVTSIEARLQNTVAQKLTQIHSETKHLVLQSADNTAENTNALALLREQIGWVIAEGVSSNFGHLEQQLQVKVKCELEACLDTALLSMQSAADVGAQRHVNESETKMRQLIEERLAALTLRSATSPPTPLPPALPLAPSLRHPWNSPKYQQRFPQMTSFPATPARLVRRQHKRRC